MGTRDAIRRPHRRAFILGSLGGLAALARPLGAHGTADAAPTLVLVQLSGGWDGLSTLVPYSDDVYARARRATRIAAADVLKLDARVGLHPELGGLRALYERGSLALVEGVGYPEPNRSHFRSLDIWHAGDVRGRAAGAGWIGRAAEQLPDASAHAVVHFGLRPNFALHSSRRAPVCLTDVVLRTADAEQTAARAAALEREPDGTSEPHANGETLALVRERWQVARESTARLRQALEEHESPVAYPPRSAFARELRSAAALIHSGLGVRVISLEYDGFDTHRDQRGRYTRLMNVLDGGLAAFCADLERSEAGRAAIVLCFSEFGRRVEENASGGTDHGAAGLALVLGPGVRGGLHGRPPALDALVDGDLAFTTDFRAVYARCLEHVLGLAPQDVLGASFPGLAFV